MEAIAANQALQIAIEATLLVKQIQVNEIFPQILSEVVLAGSTGNEILLDMLKEATGGINPGLAHDDNMRRFTANDVLELAARLVAKKKLSKEATRANTEAEAAVNEANMNAETARDASNANALNGQAGNAPAGHVLTLPAQMDQINVLAPIIRHVAP